jgi:hypothetical protein
VFVIDPTVLSATRKQVLFSSRSMAGVDSNPNLVAMERILSAPNFSAPYRAKAVLHDSVSAWSSVVVASGQMLGLAFLMKNPPVCGGSYLGPAGRTLLGDSPLSSIAAAMTTLNVDPGGKRSENARLRSGLLASLSSAVCALKAAVRSWVDTMFGS